MRQGEVSEQDLLEALALQPHPEGGWYRETWRAPSAHGERASASAILFLLAAGQRSHWHQVDAAEIWMFQAGSPLRLLTAPHGKGPVLQEMLGADILAGERPQLVVEANHWQSAETGLGWTLVSCLVSPAFEFKGFTLAPEGWEPGCGAFLP